jgi:hypothetical protein
MKDSEPHQRRLAWTSCSGFPDDQRCVALGTATQQAGQRPGVIGAETFSGKETNRMTITESAVAQRIRRKLRNTGHMLRKSRGERQRVDSGGYYIIDSPRNILAWHHMNGCMNQ